MGVVDIDPAQNPKAPATWTWGRENVAPGVTMTTEGVVAIATSLTVAGVPITGGGGGGGAVNTVNGVVPDGGGNVQLVPSNLGALAVAQNLADVADPATARTNLGLGTAAITNTGTGATNTILGNDARLTDARTPLAHAASHAAAGSDPLTLAQSQITNLVTDLGLKQPLNADLTAIAALTPSNDDLIQRKSGAWTNRTIAQVKSDMDLTYAGSVPWAFFPRAAYTQIGGVMTVRSSKAVTLNAMYLIPYFLLRAATLTSVAFELTSSTANAVARIGWYAADASLSVGSSAALIAEAGSSPFTADTIGQKLCTVSQTLPTGIGYLAICFQTAAPNVRHAAGWNPFVSSATFPTGTGTGWNCAYVQTGVTGALPSTVSTTTDTDAPLVGFKF